MKKLLLTAFLGAALVGCSTTNGTPTIGGIPITTIEQQVQTDVLQICAFVPTAQTIANVVTAAVGVPGLSTAFAIATGICNAVTTAPAGSISASVSRARVMLKRGVAPPTYIGVPIYGSFVR